MSEYILGLDIGSSNVRAAIAKVDKYGFQICGFGQCETSGIVKGSIKNIEKAAESVKKATLEAQKSAGVKYDICVVSISPACAKCVKSEGVISIAGSEITTNEIERAVKIAQENARIPKDYHKLHVLPYDFKVNNQDDIEDPLGMSGNRLEVNTYVVAVPGSAIKDFQKVLELANICADNIILSSYATSLATLTRDEKELGVALIDLGSDTCDTVVYVGNSMRHSDSLLVGSSVITRDLSRALHIPLASAESIKLEYGKLIDQGKNSVEAPVSGQDGLVEIDLGVIVNVISGKLEMILGQINKQILQSGYEEMLGAGIVLTGGMAKFDEIREFMSELFVNVPVRVAKPIAVDGLSEISNDTQNSCVIGLCLYGAGNFTQYELDSNDDFRYRGESKKKPLNLGREIDKAIESKDDITSEDMESIKLANREIVDNIGRTNGSGGFNMVFWLKWLYKKIMNLF